MGQIKYMSSNALEGLPRMVHLLNNPLSQRTATENQLRWVMWWPFSVPILVKPHVSRRIVEAAIFVSKRARNFLVYCM